MVAPGSPKLLEIKSQEGLELEAHLPRDRRRVAGSSPGGVHGQQRMIKLMATRAVKLFCSLEERGGADQRVPYRVTARRCGCRRPIR
jgi:hypothetical protein